MLLDPKSAHAKLNVCVCSILTEADSTSEQLFFDWAGFVKTRMIIASVATAVLVAVVVVLSILYWLAYANAD